MAPWPRVFSEPPVETAAPRGVGGFTVAHSRGPTWGGGASGRPDPESVRCACSEFMVEEHELRKEKIQEDYNDKYWDQRYTVVQHQIPSFLQKMAGKVLSTGEPCGPGVPLPVALPSRPCTRWCLPCLSDSCGSGCRCFVP